jgi:hypothetical protein
MDEVIGFNHLSSRTIKIEKIINPRMILRIIFGNRLMNSLRFDFLAIYTKTFTEQDHNRFLPRDDI